MVPIDAVDGGFDGAADAGLHDDDCRKYRPIALRQSEHLRQRISQKPGHGHTQQHNPAAPPPWRWPSRENHSKASQFSCQLMLWSRRDSG